MLIMQGSPAEAQADFCFAAEQMWDFSEYKIQSSATYKILLLIK